MHREGVSEGPQGDPGPRGPAGPVDQQTLARITALEQRLAEAQTRIDQYQNVLQFLRVENGDLVRAFGAINYAHAWIDCAVKIGLFYSVVSLNLRTKLDLERFTVSV